MASVVLDTIRERAVALTVTRPTTETLERGRVTRVGASVVGVTGHMQPLSPKEMRLVPEGLNQLEWWNIWTLAEVKTGDLITDGTAPSVTALQLEYWNEGPFWRVQGTVVTEDEGIPLTIATVGSATGDGFASAVGVRA